MFDYLQKFNQLPEEVRARISSATVMSAINELEEKYGIDLAISVMKIMVSAIKFSEIALYFMEQEGLSADQAKALAKELESRVFFDLRDHLGLGPASADLSMKSDVSAIVSQVNPVVTKVPPRSIAHTQAQTSKTEDTKNVQEASSDKDTINIQDPKTEHTIEDRIDNVVEEARIRFSSQFVAERFKAILNTYLRGVRNKVDTKLTLGKSFENGGLGLEMSVAERVIAVAEKYRENTKTTMQKPSPIGKHLSANEPAMNKKVDFSKIIGTRDQDYDLATVLAERLEKSKEQRATTPPKDITDTPSIQSVVNKVVQKVETPQVAFPKLDTGHEIAPPTPRLVPVQSAPVETKQPISELKNIDTPVLIKKSPAPIVNNSFVGAKVSEKVEKISDLVPRMMNQRPPEPQKMNERMSDGGVKMRIEDVRTTPKVMGPIEELRFLDLINFRRLGISASERVNKIEEKLKILEQDNFAKRVEGIQAWRKNPVYQLYLDMAKEAIIQNHDISAIINNRKKTSVEYLELDEIEAIINFNNKIRF